MQKLVGVLVAAAAVFVVVLAPIAMAGSGGFSGFPSAAPIANVTVNPDKVLTNFIDAGVIYDPGNLTVDGTTFNTASGTAMRFTAGGSLDLSTNGAGTLKFANSEIEVGGGGGTISPTSDQNGNLGSTTRRWSNVYASIVNIIAGTSASTGVASSVLTVNTSAVGNGADTTEDVLQTYPVPANALSANGKGIRYTTWGSGVSTSDVTTVRCYFGDPSALKSGTLIVSKVLTASQANTWRVVAEVIRTGASAQLATAIFENGGTAASVVQSNSTPAGVASGAMVIGCSGQRATTSTANSVQQLGGIVETIN